MKAVLASVAAAGVSAVLSASAAHAGILNFQAELKAAPHATAAAHSRGEVNAMVDTDRRVLDYTVTYSGLSGPVSAGFDSGAGTTVVAAPAGAGGKPIHGVATLTDAEINDLAAGRWYFDLRSSGPTPAELKGSVHRVSD